MGSIRSYMIRCDHRGMSYSLLLIIFFSSAWFSFKTQESDPGKEIKVGIYENPPKIFLKEKEKADGIFIDILEILLEKENLKPKYVPGSWSVLKEKLANGEIDMLPDVAYSDKRNSLFLLNNVPVLSSWLEVYSLQDTPVESVLDLEDKKLGVLNGSVQEEYFTEYVNNNLQLEYKVVTFEDYPASVEALHKKEIDILIASRFFYFSRYNNGEINSSGIIFRPSDLHFGFSPDTDPALVKRLDNHLSLLKNDPHSDYYNILRLWFDPAQHTLIPDYLWWLFGFLLLLLLCITAFIIILRYQVKLKTQALWKRNRQLSLAKEKAEENERLKTIFLQNMSHEIRTPMNGIIGFLQLLKEPDLDPQDREKYIDIVIKSGKRLLTTINNIIEISKIDSDQIHVHPAPVNIPEIMEFYHDFFAPQARDKKIQLKLNQKFGEEDGTILTDKFILDNILTNLINNALKFTHAGVVEFGNYRKGETIVFYVRDTGVGISPDRQNAIFERFVQANLDITRPHEGSGLGLAIVKAYVKALHGKIWLESEEDKGSTFFFSIPYTPIAAGNSENEANHLQLEVTDKKLKILIAEDDQISYLFIRQILNQPEITVLRAKSGLESIELLKSDPQIDLVLMDIKMPELDGIEATKQIRKFNPQVPIIVQTAYSSSEDKERALEAGCNDYINKPIDKERLLQLIRKYT